MKKISTSSALILLLTFSSAHAQGYLSASYVPETDFGSGYGIQIGKLKQEGFGWYWEAKFTQTEKKDGIYEMSAGSLVSNYGLNKRINRYFTLLAGVGYGLRAGAVTAYSGNNVSSTSVKDKGINYNLGIQGHYNKLIGGLQYDTRIKTPSFNIGFVF